MYTYRCMYVYIYTVFRIPRYTVFAQHRGAPSPGASHMTTVAVRVDVNAQPRTAVAVRSAPF